MAIYPVVGMPGMRDATPAEHRRVLHQGDHTSLAGGARINGTKSRDSGNTGFLTSLRPGLLIGLESSGNEWAPSILGVLQAAASGSATSVTVSAAQATEINRRIGATGTLNFIGPPTANGTVAIFTETYSAINTTTGVITVSGLDAALVAGSFVAANDGTQRPRSFVPDENPHGGWAVLVADVNGNAVDVQTRLPIAGILDSDRLLPVWPSDTSLQQWIMDHLNGTGDGVGYGSGKFVFKHSYRS